MYPILVLLDGLKPFAPFGFGGLKMVGFASSCPFFHLITRRGPEWGKVRGNYLNKKTFKGFVEKFLVSHVEVLLPVHAVASGAESHTVLIAGATETGVR